MMMKADGHLPELGVQLLNPEHHDKPRSSDDAGYDNKERFDRVPE
jgi:hypothetical protein